MIIFDRFLYQKNSFNAKIIHHHNKQHNDPNAKINDQHNKQHNNQLIINIINLPLNRFKIQYKKHLLSNYIAFSFILFGILI